MLDDVAQELGGKFPARRFIPFVVMHEFEGLLFSDPDRFSEGIDRPDLAPRLRAIRDAFNSPEEIDDSPVTAPSKRVTDLAPGYDKPFHGTLAALQIGLAAIRAECPHFQEWLERLEAWPGSH